MNKPQAENFRSGFVSLLGRPNVGKSTLLNTLLGTKLAIVSDKPQTTRTSIQGVLNTANAQIVFLDTPGIHEAESPINRRMMREVHAALKERDVLLFLADATRPFNDADRKAIALMEHSGAPALLVLNKIDVLKNKSLLLPLIESYQQAGNFEEYLPVSALTGEGVDEIIRHVVERLPEGPMLFPPDHLTDQPERFLAAELIRERILIETRLEVPHSVAVLIEHWVDLEGLSRVAAAIYVEREGQKAIIIGKGGAMLKRIGTAARQQMEALLGRRFYLELFVKVRPKWKRTEAFLEALDWRTMRGGKIDV